MRLYKAHVLSYIESGTPGYFHGSVSVLACVDRVQRRLLREVGISEEQALLNFRLAPLHTRRCMAILGFLHRVVLGKVSAQIALLFPRTERQERRDFIGHRVRGFEARHDKQLHDRISTSSTDQFKRSIFGMIPCYNALPQEFVDISSIKAFQKKLQTSLIHQARSGHISWQDVFSDGRRHASLLRFQSFFQV